MRTPEESSERGEAMPSRTVDTAVDINADKDAVWNVLTDFASYEEWSPVMRIEGAPEVGTKLHVHLTGARGGGVAFKPKVQSGSPGQRHRRAGTDSTHVIIG